MKKLITKAFEYWYLIITAAVLLVEAAVFGFFGDHSYIAVHDNLDLFVGHLEAMRHSGTFFAGGEVPILGGITRDFLSSEFSLYNIWYMILPPFAAYMTGYALKILIGLGSVILLVRDVYRESYEEIRPAAVLCGLMYGLVPVFPAYGIAFSSIPLCILILRKIYYRESKWYYAALFFYPLLSYFSYFGIFLLGYLCLAILILWVRDYRRAEAENRFVPGSKRSARFLASFSTELVLAVIVLAAGYVIFEYRLFREMLFSDTVSMRSTMVEDSLYGMDLIRAVADNFLHAQFHAQPSHTRFLLPVCALGLLWMVIRFIKGERKALINAFCLVFYFIIGNCLVYGLYYFEPFRSLVQTLVPQLAGFQFSRTVFFNPFLWYADLFLLVRELYRSSLLGSKKRAALLGNAALILALCVVLFTPQVYNDFYYTCYYNAYRIVKHTEVENLNFSEFYSVDLFEEILADIDYDGEYSAAYGMHPAVLSYNGISTLDGYLGFYPQAYKDAFSILVHPATERVEEWKTYYEDWGARAYIFSGSGENTWNPVRTMHLSDNNLYIDADQFRTMGGRYIFSRIELANATDLGLTLRGTYTDETSPYIIYLYDAR